MAEADFSGYATKAGLKCSDGRTILAHAFQKQDGAKVPLVWHHAHDEPKNVLGHAILENRDDGVYCQGFFNQTEQGKASKVLVQHGDITELSIFANKLVEQSMNVVHGVIREVSLVIAGANPGAKIDFVSLQHSDGSIQELDDEAIITTGLKLEHSESPAEVVQEEPAEVAPEPVEVVPEETSDESTVEHAVGDDKTVQDVYDSMSEEQQNVVGFIVEAALDEAKLAKATAEGETALAQSAIVTEGETTEVAVETTTEGDLTHQEGTTEMTNVFEQSATKSDGPTLSHDQLSTIVADAAKLGSFKDSFLAHAAEYGITDIDVLFPDAKTVTSSPEWISRRMEWVSEVLDGAKHSPFSRIKSTAADITADQARAKGYVKGNMKKDEVIKLLKRVTTPKTIYKKQKLDRDDIIDITDLDVVAWLKAEMRLMLEEELGRAVLIGDGREPDDEDKIDQDHIRPIAYDDSMYTHKVNVASETPAAEIVKAVLRARQYYKGTGTPTLFTTDSILTDLILLEDKMGRRLYETEASLAASMRVSKIVVVEVMEDNPDLLAIIVNMADYTIGADRGGNISMFDDFDIDYNQFKYLIETRVSGALTKPKSAVVITRSVGIVVTSVQPTYDPATKTITFPTTTGVDYQVDGVTRTGQLVITESTEVEAVPQSGYAFANNTDNDWFFAF